MKIGWFVSDRCWWLRQNREWISDSCEGHMETSLPSVVLLSANQKKVSGVAIGKKSGRADSFRSKFEFTDWFACEPFEISEPLKGLKGQAQRAASDAVQAEVGRFTEKTSGIILVWLESKRPELYAEIQRLSTTTVPAWLRTGSSSAITYAEQLDALKLGLDIAGLDRVAALENLRHPESEQDLPLVKLLEDQIVFNDTTNFMGWESEQHIFAGATFEDPRSGRTLKTFLANKHPLEERTGADVIYYIHDYDAFVLVQYKRCRPEGKSGHIYRPDIQLEKELKRLRKLEPGTQTRASELKGHRIGQPFCFMKVCHTYQYNVPMSRGRYLDLNGFELSLEEGPNGGKRVVWDEMDRYMTNTLFADLVTQGWIGSSGAASEDVKVAMEAALEANRSVILGEITLDADKKKRRSFIKSSNLKTRYGGVNS